jgi:hypothetical protein
MKSKHMGRLGRFFSLENYAAWMPVLAAPPIPADSLQTPVICRDAPGQTKPKSPIISICEVGGRKQIAI